MTTVLHVDGETSQRADGKHEPASLQPYSVKREVRARPQEGRNQNQKETLPVAGERGKDDLSRDDRAQYKRTRKVTGSSEQNQQ